jgi:hypothetical protein
VRGTFSGVVRGTWETGSRVPVMPAAAGLIAAAVVSWLATLLWLLALMLGAFLVLALGGLVAIRRYNLRATGRFMAQAAALAEAAPKRAVTAAAAPALTVNHYHGGTHLHFGAESAGPRIIQAVPQKRDAIAEIKEE